MPGNWAPALLALFVWWFSTGAILMVVKHADRRGGPAYLWSVIAALPMLLAGIWGFTATMNDPTVWGTYLAFLSALAVWGWIELAFLTGIIAGPNHRPCPPGYTPSSNFTPWASGSSVP